MFASEKVKAVEGLVMLAGILSAGVLAYQGAMRVARIYGPLQAIGLVALAVVAVVVIQRAVRHEVDADRAAREFLTEATDQEHLRHLEKRDEEYAERLASLEERERGWSADVKSHMAEWRAREAEHAAAIAEAKRREDAALARLKRSEARMAELRKELDAHEVRPPCPKCGARPIPIVYGNPREEMFAEAERGEIALGGCERGLPNEPNWSCPKCHEKWPDPELVALREA